MSELFFHSRDTQGEIFLDEEETRHCIKVCRHRPGDIIEITDGKENAFKAQILAYGKKTSLKILEKINVPSSTKTGFLLPLLHVRDRMEFAVEKLTELGITDFYLTRYDRCQKSKQNLARLSKIIKASVKQSRRYFLPEVHPPLPLEKHLQRISRLYSMKIVATMNAKTPAFFYQGSVLLSVGPEGGFTERELKIFKNHNFQEVSLGDNRLRSETSAIVLTAKIL